jgi:WD40 repeat protein
MDPVASFVGHNALVTACRCCPAGDVSVAGDDSGSMALWDLRNVKKCLWKQSLRNPHPNGIWSVDFDSTGFLFCISTRDNGMSI